MASQSLYRKWRSQTFADLVGQAAITRTLLHAVRDGRLAHAYLFCGPRGTGKTSSARLLAKAINCAAPVDGEPCNTCLSCREITSGSSPNVIEIDAASNTGVDNIRDLRQNVSLLSTTGKYKVYIVDEVHMLSTQAFNALLKTLEEPPPHVIFVLATTEAHKVLPTVVSRCQQFDFRRISTQDIMGHLMRIAREEKVELEPAAADLLARAAQGGMRDALSLLDQAIAYSGNHVDAQGARAMLGLADAGAVRRLLECVADQNTAEGMHIIDQLVTGGAELRQLNAQLTEEVRALLVARAGASVATVMNRSEDEAREIGALASRFSLEELTACARVFTTNETPARGLPVPQLALEIAFLECVAIRRNGVAPVATAPSAAPGRAESTATPATPRSAPPAPPVRSTPVQTAREAAAPIEELDLAALANEPVVAPASRPAPQPVIPAASEPEDLFADDDTPAPFSADEMADLLGQVKSRWELIKQVCKQKSMSIAALLHSAHPSSILTEDGTVLVLAVDHDFHFTKLRDPKGRVAIEWALEQVLSQRFRVRLVMSNGGNGKGALSNRGGSGGGGSSAPAIAPTPTGEQPTGRRGVPGGGTSPQRANGLAPVETSSYIPTSPTVDVINEPPEPIPFARAASARHDRSSTAPATGQTAPDTHAKHRPSGHRKLEEQVNADAVIQTLIRNGIRLADVRALDDEADAPPDGEHDAPSSGRR